MHHTRLPRCDGNMLTSQDAVVCSSLVGGTMILWEIVASYRATRSLGVTPAERNILYLQEMLPPDH